MDKLTMTESAFLRLLDQDGIVSSLLLRDQIQYD